MIIGVSWIERYTYKIIKFSNLADLLVHRYITCEAGSEVGIDIECYLRASQQLIMSITAGDIKNIVFCHEHLIV